MTISIEFNDESLTPLYLKYSGQCNPQPAYVSMDECGVITADADGNIGNSMSSHVWNARTIRFKCPNSVKSSALIEYLNDQDTQSKFQQLHDMHSVEWDGSNHVGIFTDYDEMESIVSTIECELEALDVVDIYEPYQVIENMSINEIWRGSWDETLDQLVDDDIYIDGDLKNCIIEYAQNEYDQNGIDSIPLTMREFIDCE